MGAGIGPTLIHGVLGVVKAYTTRVGNGPLPTEAPSPHGDRLREVGGEFGAVTGRPRRCGWFDATVVRYAARVNGLTGLAVTKLDVLDGFEEIPVCTAYRLDGDACEEMPAEVEALGRVEPTYEVLPGLEPPDRWRPQAGRSAVGGPGLPRPAGGAVGGAGAVRERGDAAGSDHREYSGDAVDQTDLLVIGAGPCGLAVGVAAKKAGLPCVLLDRRTIVSTIERYPLSMTFFSTPERIEIGEIPFIASHEKPTRRDGLIYYRRVAEHYGLDVRPSEEVVDVVREPEGGLPGGGPAAARREDLPGRRRRLRHGLLRQPQFSRIPGRGPAPRRALLLGGPSLLAPAGGGDRGGEQQRGRGARVLAGRRDRDPGALRRGVRQDGQGLGAAGHREPGEGGEHRGPLALAGPGDHPDRGGDRLGRDGAVECLPTDAVLAMTGYHADTTMLQRLGVPVDPATGIPAHDETTMATPLPGSIWPASSPAGTTPTACSSRIPGGTES